jgi:RNA polymerase sigma factor (sigma-70 family)
MQTMQFVAFKAAEVDRDREIGLGNQIKLWRDAQTIGRANPKVERNGQNAAAKLAEENQRYLPNVLRWYWDYKSIDTDEFWTAGFLGLVQAAKRYDPELGYFWHFAKKFVHGEIQDTLRKNYAIVLPKWKFAEAQQNPELKGLLTHLPINEETLTLIDILEEDFGYSVEEVWDAVDSLPPDLREIIEKIYGLSGNAVTQTVIAQERNVSNTTVSNRKKRAFRLLKEYLENPESKPVAENPEINVIEPTVEISAAQPEIIEAVPAIEPIAEVEAEVPPIAPIQEIRTSESETTELELEVQAIERATEFVTVAEVENFFKADTTKLSNTETTMKCLNCKALIPKPIEGIKVACSMCCARFELQESGQLKRVTSQTKEEPIVYKDSSLNLPKYTHRKQQAHEHQRIITLNDLARTYAELEQRGPQFEPVREPVLKLWRETNDYYLFDEAAMDRVAMWIEEVENFQISNTA